MRVCEDLRIFVMLDIQFVLALCGTGPKINRPKHLAEIEACRNPKEKAPPREGAFPGLSEA
jgi:hypothetical protein